MNGGWGSWQQWSTCSQNIECFKGSRTSKRTCSNPSPSKGGDDCFGSGDEHEVCPKKNCKGLLYIMKFRYFGEKLIIIVIIIINLLGGEGQKDIHLIYTKNLVKFTDVDLLKSEKVNIR